MRIYDWFGSFGSFPISRYQCPSITIEGNKPVGFRLRSDHERTPSRVQIFCSINFNRIINDLNANCAEVNMTAIENWWLSRTAMRISFSRERERERERERHESSSTESFFLLSPGEHVASGICIVLYIGILQRRQFSPLIATSSLQRRWNNRL